MAVFSLIHLFAAASAGERGRAALTRAERSLSARRLDAARRDLSVAEKAFIDARKEMAALGLIADVARRIPLVGHQVKAVETFGSAGLELSRAGQPLVDAAATIVRPRDEQVPVSAAMEALRDTQQLLGPAVTTIANAAADVARLKGGYLIGPLARTRSDLAARLPRIQMQAMSAEQGLTSLMAFAGESGPKRYLFLSQNPDEVRPTGGFIGTYGVLTAAGGQMKLERYDDMLAWTKSRPQIAVPPEEVGPPFQYHDPPLPRTMANVNSVPDWPTAARLAAELWKNGGEEPVDGVISFMPGFMARVLSVVGPVRIPGYNETVTAKNLHDRLDFHVHLVERARGEDRKDFVAAVAETVMHKLLDAPASKWEPLSRVMGQAFDAREAMAWSTDPQVARTLADRRWDGAFPSTDGDFFYNSEFQYLAKNGRGIRRHYDHNVVLHPDGSARIATKLTVTNTLPPEAFGNASTMAYLTIYGPEGAVLDEAASDPLGFKEPSLAGHPATGWFRAAAPSGGQATLNVTWDVPRLAKRVSKDSWEYSLHWMHLPDHKGDTVNLTFELPEGWRWNDVGPPTQFSLDQDMVGSWQLASR